MCKYVHLDSYKWNDCKQSGHFFGTLEENDYNIGFIIVNRTMNDGEFYCFWKRNKRVQVPSTAVNESHV